MTLPIARSARRIFGLDEFLQKSSESSRVLDVATARRVAHAVSSTQARADETLTAGRLLALGAIHGLMKNVVRLYEESAKASLFSVALQELVRRRGRTWVDEVLARYRDEFGIGQSEAMAENHGTAETSIWTREQILEEILLASLLCRYPAARGARELIAPQALLDDPGYRTLVSELNEIVAQQPRPRQAEAGLYELLSAPSRDVSDSLSEQLRHAAERWLPLLGLGGTQIDAVLDALAEEETPRPPPGPGPVEVPSYDFEAEDAPQYSAERGWMSQLVLVAKNVYVWLSQLSLEFDRPIERLDEVPDEALLQLCQRGFNCLWLIGLWQRSSASRRIKRMTGNTEAEASAYSVASYRIADDLGGETAYRAFRRRAADCGVRVAADMVPNHMGIDSEWVLDHPEWFLGADESPFPSYTFDGPDLSPRADVAIYLEDHYYDRSDAAVTFKHVDCRSNHVRYLYHGNDGTSIPWNDTAQLDYLNPTVREAVIQTVLDVARRFEVIRFDAAMTLTRSHYQRLWFPQPGSGGAIPSRAEHAMSKEEFALRMPQEFWREVVHRVATECPDTLLLAEAFWLMEAYFVRSLGMHRVYNSAFMNLLHDGENAKFRNLIKETLAFDARILKRWVNFMSNPDERTAIDQFGRDDRYFGTCVLMATLPGMPMFAHGQFEGFTERYGMEYRRAYEPEVIDHELVQRHEQEISPLLLRRDLFAEVDEFFFYDFTDVHGQVVEDVLAFSNGRGDERVVVLFHNRGETAQGRIFESVPYATAPDNGAAGQLTTRRLADVLDLCQTDDQLLYFRDLISGHEDARLCSEIFERGLEIELGPFEYLVLSHFGPVAPLSDKS